VALNGPMIKEFHLDTYLVIARQLIRAFIVIVGIGIAIPLVSGFIFGIQPGKILALIISTVILQNWAFPVGLGFKIPPGIILLTMTCFALSVVLAIFEVLDTLAFTSPRIKSWLDKTQKKMGKYTFLYKYGAFACFFIALLPGLGLVVTAVIAWALRFNKWLSVFSIVFAFFLTSLLVMVLTLGI
jgi:hypothetical protein